MYGANAPCLNRERERESWIVEKKQGVGEGDKGREREFVCFAE